MVKKIKIIKKNEQNLSAQLDEYKKVDIVFRILSEDTRGKSATNPTWGYVFNVRDGKLKLNIEPDGLYKEFDYDYPNASYAEKIYSIIAKEVLTEDTRIPTIDVVKENNSIYGPSTISYKLMNNDKEDMFHIADIMFYKYEREEIEKKKHIFTIEDILECLKEQISDEENYKKIEKSLIHTILMDSILNNLDRHDSNWALVRNKETNKYELAIFDHSISLIDMIEENRTATYNGWVKSYISTGKTSNSSFGKDIIEYIHKNYGEYFDEFVDKFNEKLPVILNRIKEENLSIDTRRLENKLNARNIFLKMERDKEEFDYGEQ